MKDTFKILAIESSCDETAAAVVLPGGKVLSNVIHSQIALHAKYGGVVPELASRQHIKSMPYVVDAALRQAGVSAGGLDAVAVTYGPGLSGALLCGVNYAKAFAWGLGIPLIGVNHMVGHICANHITHPELQPPYIALIISGGHTLLVHVCGELDYILLGGTRDDAAGEAFDKVARTLGLGYPGGPQLEELARGGDENAYSFTKPKLDKPLDFSFSGIKTAVINLMQNAKSRGQAINTADVAASFQKRIADFLCDNALAACRGAGSDSLSLCGGVCANGYIRGRMQAMAEKQHIKLYLPEKKYCTDNAAMIGCAAQLYIKNNKIAGMNLNAIPNLGLKTSELN